MSTVDESVGLTQLGARLYDSTFGRFISVDPLMDPTDSQQMHGYAYANNNPVSLTETDGLAAICMTSFGVPHCFVWRRKSRLWMTPGCWTKYLYREIFNFGAWLSLFVL